MTLHVVLIIIFCLLFATVQSQDCVFNVSSNTTPFIVDKNYSFPTNLTFQLNEFFYVSCIKGTSSKYLAEDGDPVACKGGTNILNVRTVELLDFNDIVCKPVTSFVQNLNKTCENNGSTFEVGYKIYLGFAPEYSVCFDETKLSPFYVKYNNYYLTMTGGNKISPFLDAYDFLRCTEGKGYCDFADDGDIYPNINLDSLYLDQENIFEELGVTVQDTLIKLPLALNIYELTQPIQTYPYWNYINVVPLWQTLFERWLFVSVGMSVDIVGNIIYTGTLGVATLPNAAGNSVQLYLSNNQVPVPRWIWNLYETSDSIAIIFCWNSFLDIQNENKGEVCSTAYVVSQNIILCYIDSVIDPEMQIFIDNLCKNIDCQSKRNKNIPGFNL